MNRSSNMRIHPAWPSVAALAAAVGVLFLDALSTSAVQHRVVRIAGALILAATVVARWVSWKSALPDSRGVLRRLLLATAGVGAAIAVYCVASPPLALRPWPPSRLDSILALIWPGLLLCSALPLAAIELAVAPVAHQPRYEERRVRAASARGLGVGLFLIFLGALNFVISGVDRFTFELAPEAHPEATSRTIALVRKLPRDVRVVSYYPQNSRVGRIVEAYLAPLAALNPKLKIERADYAVDIDTAVNIGVQDDDWVVVYGGEAHDRFRAGRDDDTALVGLRSLDQNFATALLNVMEGHRIAYFTTGHQERSFGGVAENDRRPPVKSLVRQLEDWQFQVRPLGVGEGSTTEVPSDADLVLVMAPDEQFLPGEIAALIAYVDRGGRLYVALSPGTGDRLARLLAALGLRYDDTPLANAQTYTLIQRAPADRYHLWTNAFEAHASVGTLHARDDLRIVLWRSGSLEAVGPARKDWTTTIVMRALEGTFQDANGDTERSPEESSGPFGLAAAVTRTSSGSGEARPGRAYVLADVDAVSDALLSTSQTNVVLLADAVNWLLESDTPIAPTVSLGDVRLVHRREEDALTFYATTFVPPLLIFGVALLRRSRRR